MYAIHYKELVKKDEGINNNMAKKRDKKNMMKKPLQRNYGDKVAVIWSERTGQIYSKGILIFMEKADSDRRVSLAYAIMDCRKARMHLSFCAKNWCRDILMELQESMHLRQGIW